MNWLNRPKVTPMQMFIIFAMFFYFIYLNTEYFDSIPDLVQALIYAGGLILSALAGYSAIDSKRLGHLIKKTMRQRDKSIEVKWNECIEIIDSALFDMDYYIEKKKKKKR